MKKFILLLFAGAFMSMQLQAQTDAISKYFDKYMDDERFSMVYISPKMFEMISKVELEGDKADQEIMDMIKDLEGLRILSFEGSGAQTFYTEVKSKIDANKYDDLVVVRDKGENVNISVNSQGDIVNELLLLVGSDDNFVLMSFTGNIDLKKVGKLGKVLDMEGVEHLGRINGDKDHDKDKDK